MKKLTVSELRVAARVLQNRPRVSAMEDADFCASVLQLISDTQRGVYGSERCHSLFSSSLVVCVECAYRTVARGNPSGARKSWPQGRKRKVGGPEGLSDVYKFTSGGKAVVSLDPANSGVWLQPSWAVEGPASIIRPMNVGRLRDASTVYRNGRLLRAIELLPLPSDNSRRWGFCYFERYPYWFGHTGMRAFVREVRMQQPRIVARN